MFGSQSSLGFNNFKMVRRKKKETVPALENRLFYPRLKAHYGGFIKPVIRALTREEAARRCAGSRRLTGPLCCLQLLCSNGHLRYVLMASALTVSGQTAEKQRSKRGLEVRVLHCIYSVGIVSCRGKNAVTHANAAWLGILWKPFMNHCIEHIEHIISQLINM